MLVEWNATERDFPRDTTAQFTVVGEIGHDLADTRGGCLVNGCLENEVVRVREVAVGRGDRYLGCLCDIGNGQRTAVRG